jgi:hypothetical protein
VEFDAHPPVPGPPMRGDDMDLSVKTQADLRKRIVHGWNTDTPPVTAA